jgi:Protein of unknown function (DUF1769)/Domain found in Dishevelled, Egl-10, and Pleckstrin (DEP)
MDNSTNSRTSSTGSSSNSDELALLAKSLKNAVEIKDRHWHTMTYSSCFLHSEAVAWMTARQGGDERAAVASLNALREAGFIQHVVDPHKKFQVGQNKTLYFHFVADDCVAKKRWQRQKSILKSTAAGGQGQVTRQSMEDFWSGSEEWLSHKTRVDRMASSIAQLTETQMSVRTKLEIVHQATISLIQAMVATALLLLALLGYTVFVIIPSLHQATGIFVVTAAMATLLVSAFVFQGSRIFSVWLSLDSCVVQATEGQDAVEDYEMALTLTGESTKKHGAREGGLGRRMRSSIMLREPILRTQSSGISVKDSMRNLSAKVQQRQAGDIPDPCNWPQRPVLLCVNTPVSESLVAKAYGDGPLPLGKPFHFSSELFEGHCLVRLKNVPNSDNPFGDSAYFSGRRRLFQTIIQGRFKEPLPVSDVLTGHEFVKPLQNLPHPWILSAATNLIGKLAPGAEIRVLGSHPTMLASLAATSQVVRGDEPGNEPYIGGEEDLQEDCSLLGGKFSSGRISAAGRKLHLANPNRAKKYTFDTETVYTFDFYQSLLNVVTYSLELGVANIGMAPILNGQPIQCLCKTTDGRYLWSFQLWHESLLQDDDTVSTVSSTSSKKTR